MKSSSSALAAHLAGEVTTLATCWRITRTDRMVFRFTDHDRDLLVEGEIYSASSGYSRTAIASEAGLAVDNLDVEGVFSEALSEADLRAGRFDQAEVRIFLVNWATPGQGVLKLRRGWFGEVVLAGQGLFRTELRGLAQALAQRIGELYGPGCRADLGDPRCRVPILPPLVARSTAYAEGATVRAVTNPAGQGSFAYQDRIHRCIEAGTTAAAQPAYATAVGAVTTDGSAWFEALEAWSRAGIVQAVESRTTFTASLNEPRAVDGWFAGGVLTFESGANEGQAVEVKAWSQAPGRIELYLPTGYPVLPGDLFRVHPGCDKRLDTCIERFGNVLNFRGEPYVPGPDLLMTYPDAR